MADITILGFASNESNLAGYLPLRIGPYASAAVEAFIRDPIEWTLRDVRDMLRLPLPALGMTAGCNYAVANVLLTHIAGLATVFMTLVLSRGTGL